MHRQANTKGLQEHQQTDKRQTAIETTKQTEGQKKKSYGKRQRNKQTHPQTDIYKIATKTLGNTQTNKPK